MFAGIRRGWTRFADARPTWAQLIVFSLLNVGMTVLQLVLMPVFKAVFALTPLVDTGFQALPIGSDYFIFDYAAGALPAGGGGLAYFLAVQLTLAIAQVVNFFAQRNITFKSNSNPWWAALWYTLAYVVITFGAAALQGFYKAPVYDLFITVWAMGATGETLADVVTMLINALISCAVFFPIFKIIFRRDPDPEVVVAPAPARERVGV
ncbi:MULTISPECIES: hypothetical protein [unclassified Microbacterium]|uniref:hypothetical protein n=1 Tax=unclassified Microbacterium TaxID=2609290 RepID=UPI0010CA20F9|nr:MULTISPECIES: hypothetical protein [unclassified Microbacterium]MDQ1205146.1 putative flippase GtrA [Microbacterium sp. SORGH_AS_0862]QCQ17518.1 hypothetical protein EHF32_12690 [Microbacterium sp. RG1]